MQIQTLLRINQLTEAEYMDIVQYIDFENDSINEGIDKYKTKDTKAGAFSGVASYLKDMYNKLKTEINAVKQEVGMSFFEVSIMMQAAFKTPSVFGILKMFSFSIQKIAAAINGLTGLFRDGLMTVFTEMHKLGLFQKIQKGAMTADALIAKFPLLKTVTGPALAAFMLFTWINMTFIGNPKYDFDWSTMRDAFKGKASLAAVLTGPKGTLMLSLLGLGMITGAGFAWFGLIGNVLFALLYTGYNSIKNPNRKVLAICKKRMRKITRGKVK